MTNLNDYIISEGIDPENIEYKIDTWFARDDDEKLVFTNMIDQFKNDNAVNQKVLNDYLKTSKMKVKNFVDYVTDNIKDTEINDYMYVFSKIVDTLVANKK